MKTEVNLQTFTGNKLTILEGKALEEKYPVKIVLDGDINSVAAFVSKRNNGESINYGDDRHLQLVDTATAIVIVDEQEMNITLFLDPQNAFGTQITGRLLFTPELEQFRINKNQTFNREELVKLLKFNKRFFMYPEKFEELLRAYQKMNISVASELEQKSDTRGNKGMNFQKVVNSENIPTEFILRLPIFKGQDAETFRVEICLDATDASVKFWFESVELAEMIDVKKKIIFSKQLEACQDFVIIHK